MKQVELIIIGAQKAGTTSLNKYLAQHPNIYTHFTQEFPMFASLQDCEKGIENNILQSVQKDNLKNPEKTSFIAKRVGLMYNKDMLLKLKELFPDCKIVVILRNPIERAFSAFKYCRKNGMEPYEKFEDAIFVNDESRFRGNLKFKRNCDYIFRSSYLKPVQNIYGIFPSANIRIYLFEEIINDLNAPLNEMVSSLNLPQFEFDTNTNYNEGTNSKSDFFSKFVASEKSDVLKKILPLEQRMKIKLFLKNLNTDKNKTRRILMQESTRQYLTTIFSNEVKELEKTLNLPIKKYWPEFF
jgi:hypothetical protein